MIDFTKPVQTRDGRKAEFVRMMKNEQPALVIVTHEDGTEVAENFCANGSYFGDDEESSTDLINVPVKHKHKFFLNVYPEGGRPPCAYFLKEIANLYALPDRIACVESEIEFTEGEGL